MKYYGSIFAVILVAGSVVMAHAQSLNDPIKLGAILDMSSVYADVTGPGSEMAARMAIADFGGMVLGRPITLQVADHQNKADVAAAIATQWFDADGITALLDVAASSPALAVMNVAKPRQKIVMLNGPGAQSITNEQCTATTVQYTYTTYATARTVTEAVLAQGGKSWFYVTADYTFGHQLEKASSDLVKAKGGKILGGSLAPLGTPDFSSFLLQAQGSQAQVIGLANGGDDMTNSIKQAHEFGLTINGTKLAALGAEINDIHAVGLESTGGMVVGDAFYWDTDDESRAFSKRFFDRLGKMPNMLQAGMYSSTMHYLQAVKAADTTDSGRVMEKMRAMPVNDFFARNGHVRADGLMVHDMFLFQVKTPPESDGPWDLYKKVVTIPGELAFGVLADSKCPLVKK